MGEKHGWLIWYSSCTAELLVFQPAILREEWKRTINFKICSNRWTAVCPGWEARISLFCIHTTCNSCAVCPVWGSDNGQVCCFFKKTLNVFYRYSPWKHNMLLASDEGCPVHITPYQQLPQLFFFTYHSFYL